MNLLEDLFSVILKQNRQKIQGYVKAISATEVSLDIVFFLEMLSFFLNAAASAGDTLGALNTNTL